MVPSERFKSRIGVLPYDEIPEDIGALDITPSKLVLPLSQHIGRPAEPIVQVGDTVKKGDMVAKAAEGGPSAAIHASCDGIVESVSGGKIEILSK